MQRLLASASASACFCPRQEGWNLASREPWNLASREPCLSKNLGRTLARGKKGGTLPLALEPCLWRLLASASACFCPRQKGWNLACGTTLVATRQEGWNLASGAYLALTCLCLCLCLLLPEARRVEPCLRNLASGRTLEPCFRKNPGALLPEEPWWWNLGLPGGTLACHWDVASRGSLASRKKPCFLTHSALQVRSAVDSPR